MAHLVGSTSSFVRTVEAKNGVYSHILQIDATINGDWSFLVDGGVDMNVYHSDTVLPETFHPNWIRSWIDEDQFG